MNDAAEENAPDAAEHDPVPSALDAQIYAQLRAIARRHLAQWGAGVTTSPTTIVHEAWMRLAGNGGDFWGDRAHFLLETLIDHGIGLRENDKDADETNGND